MTEAERRESWEIALGLNRLGGGEVSPDFREMIEKEIRGEVSHEEVRAYLEKVWGIHFPISGVFG